MGTTMINLLHRRGRAWIKERPNSIRSRCFFQQGIARDLWGSFIDLGFTRLAWFHRESYAKSWSAVLSGVRLTAISMAPFPM